MSRLKQLFARKDTPRQEKQPDGRSGDGLRVVDKRLGIAFTVPPGIALYSVDNPGPFQSRISAEEPFILANPAFVKPEFIDEEVTIQIVSGVTESELNGYKESLDANPNVDLPGYKRISVGFINVGKDGQIKGVEHCFQVHGNVLAVRTVSIFIGRGFFISCNTAGERFEKANREFFEPLLNSIEPVEIEGMSVDQVSPDTQAVEAKISEPTFHSVLDYREDQLLVYLFSNGQAMTGEQANIFLLACVLTDCGQDGDLITNVWKKIQGSPKCLLRLPQVPSENWDAVIAMIASERISPLHRGKKILYQKNNYDPSRPDMPDALLAVVLGADQSDFQKASQLMKTGEI